MAWQRLTVQMKGEEPVTVATSARDWASIPFDELQTAGALFRVTHNALIRNQINVPLNYDAFLEVLEAMPETVDEGEPLDPTRTEPSDDWQPR
jgi:hypothetical protein